MDDDSVWVEVWPNKFSLMSKAKAEREHPDKTHHAEIPGKKRSLDKDPSTVSMSMARAKLFQTPEMDKPEEMPADPVAKHDRMCEILNRDQPGRGRGPGGEWTRNTTDFIDE